MSDFFNKHKKLIIIILCAVVAAALAVLSAFALIKGMQKAAPSFSEVGMSSEVDETVDTSEPDATSKPDEVPSEPEDTGPKLVLSSPSRSSITVTSPDFTFTGTGDAAHELKVNGAAVPLDQNGAFSYAVKLNIGANRFVFTHKGVEKSVTVNYRYVVINGYSPSKAVALESGATLVVGVSARTGSQVTATFSGQTITLTRQGAQNNEDTEEFVHYAGQFTLPSGNRQDLGLGRIKFTGTYNGITESFSSGNITCKKTTVPQIAEVTYFTAETFNGNTTDDYSDPRNNYLPQGTVDQVVGVVQKGEFTYLKLRCGRRIYLTRELDDKSVVTVASVYDGKLPTTNTLSVAEVNEGDRYTTITLNTAWKAPFLLDVLPQSYSNPSKRDFTVSAVTAQYVEISFCYAESLTGDIVFSAENPLFSHATAVKSGSDHVLRLYLRQQGIFRGWDADYNAQGQLVFSFLHPARAAAAENKYGADLTGIRIVIDAGHGGADPGAVNKGAAAIYGYESHRNLAIAKMLKTELESIGAEVIMTRTGDTRLNSDQRRMILKNAKADFCIAIHHDSFDSSDSSDSYSPSGVGVFHFNAWSSSAAKLIFSRTVNTGLYDVNSRHTKLYWHYYYLGRANFCPVVLTENGFISSTTDFPNISSDAACLKKAEAMAQGIADYFVSY